MSAPVIDFDVEFDQIVERLRAEKEARLRPPVVRLHDGDWNERGRVRKEIGAKFEIVDNETGSYSLDMPLDYYLSRWLVDVDGRGTTNVHVTCDKDGARLSGRMYSMTVLKDERGRKYVRALFKSDYEELKHVLAWSNPFLPLAFQFPRIWINHDRARRACKTTLLVNLLRLYSSSWLIPFNPMSPAQMNTIPGMDKWWIAVHPDTTPDTSLPATVTSRFKTIHDATRRIVEDGQLSWEPRRFLRGDPPPWPGANLRHGCLVFDLVDKSAFTEGTAFRGNLLTGFINELVNIGSDGINETVEQIADPNYPPEVLTPGWRGTVPSMPRVVYREGERTGIQTSEFEHIPASIGRLVAGGHSMPGVNELLSIGIQLAGDLTAMIPGTPPLGGVADAVLKPLYTDVVAAFGGVKLNSRISRMGGSHYLEDWVDGADRAYTIAFIAAMRGGIFNTREKNRVTLTVADGAPWRIGQRGHGHFFLGDRVGFTVAGMKPGRIFVEQVKSLTLEWSRGVTPSWSIQIGERIPQDPMMLAFTRLQEHLALLRDLGVI